MRLKMKNKSHLYNIIGLGPGMGADLLTIK